jgi:serine/threonine protein kinase
MKANFLILFCFVFAHCVHGTDTPEPSKRSQPMWLRGIRKRHATAINQRKKIIAQTPEVTPKGSKRIHRGIGKFFRPEELDKLIAEHLKIPLPKTLTLEKTYDFFAEVPEKLHDFMKNSLKFHDFRDGAKIITLPVWLDHRGHVTEGRIGKSKVILKRSKFSNNPNERKNFYKFMDAAKKKLRELAAIADDPTLSEKEKKLHTQRIRNQLIGFSNIVPIIGIARFQQPDESSPEKFVDEVIEILPKVNGYTLYDCINKKLPPYDTPTGIPRDQNIAISLMIQFAQAVFALHSCGYAHGDLKFRNIMISRKGPSFSIKPVDWDKLSQSKQSSSFMEDTRDICEVFFSILLGNQFSSEEHELPITTLLDPFSSTIQKENALKDIKNHLKMAKIYSPRAIGPIIKFFKNISIPKDENEPDTEEAILTLEKQLISDLKKLLTDGGAENDDDDDNENSDSNEDFDGNNDDPSENPDKKS